MAHLVWRSSLPLMLLAFVVSVLASHPPADSSKQPTRLRAHRGKAGDWNLEDTAAQRIFHGTADSTAASGNTSGAGARTRSIDRKTRPAVPKRSKPARLDKCHQSAQLGGRCDSGKGVCCEIGLTCSDNVCIAICPVETREGYCDSYTPCDTDFGYICLGGRCRPPVGAIRVSTNEACDQGDGNTRFCLSGRGLCIDGICVACNI
ncbi:hypothetical protein JCM10908_002797 [Rhodotorula pacifica]|uniref:uncharacterized protein n=1 Tax=Rhodotorula pacifica TaxID=1495444 RepID=UPI00317049D0